MNPPAPQFNQLTMQVSVPRDQAEAFISAMQQWVSYQPLDTVVATAHHQIRLITVSRPSIPTDATPQLDLPTDRIP